MKNLWRIFPVAGLLSCPIRLRADMPSLNMGMDYRLRAVSVENNDLNPNIRDNLNYYSHSIRFYMTTWLNQNVEASLRLQSINVWGLEGSGVPVTRYPSADGEFWAENVYIHLPNFAWKRVNLTVGRQPLVWGDGLSTNNASVQQRFYFGIT